MTRLPPPLPLPVTMSANRSASSSFAATRMTLLVGPTAPFAGSESFTGGGFVAAADLDHDGRAAIM